MGEPLSAMTGLGFVVTLLGVSFYKLVRKGPPPGKFTLGFKLANITLLACCSTKHGLVVSQRCFLGEILSFSNRKWFTLCMRHVILITRSQHESARFTVGKTQNDACSKIRRIVKSACFSRRGSVLLPVLVFRR